MRFSNEANDRLTQVYNSGIDKPNRALREELGRELDKSPRYIQIWFQNRRAKGKRGSTLTPIVWANSSSQWDENTSASHSSADVQSPFLLTPNGLRSALPNLDTIPLSSESQKTESTLVIHRSASPEPYVFSRNELETNLPSAFDTGYQPSGLSASSESCTTASENDDPIIRTDYSSKPPTLGYHGSVDHLRPLVSYQQKSFTLAGPRMKSSSSDSGSNLEQIVNQRRPTLTAADIHSFFTSGIEDTTPLGAERCKSIPTESYTNNNDFLQWIQY